MSGLRITFDGKLALTTAQAAERHGLSLSSMRAAISRLGLDPVDHIDGRTPVYLANALDEAIKSRPGRGSNLTRSAEGDQARRVRRSRP